MVNKLIASVLTMILSLATFTRLSYARTQAKPQSREERRAAEVRSEVKKRSGDRWNVVSIRCRDGRELKGHINQAGQNTFRLVDRKTGDTTEVAYSEVKYLGGNRLSKGRKVSIISALAVGMVVLIGVMSFKNFHPYEHGVLR
jgi:hypothetical protein